MTKAETAEFSDEPTPKVSRISLTFMGMGGGDPARDWREHGADLRIARGRARDVGPSRRSPAVPTGTKKDTTTTRREKQRATRPKTEKQRATSGLSFFAVVPVRWAQTWYKDCEMTTSGLLFFAVVPVRWAQTWPKNDSHGGSGVQNNNPWVIVFRCCPRALGPNVVQKQ